MKKRNFSVVVITYRRPHLLKMVLHSIYDLEYTLGEIELLVVDNDPQMSARFIVDGFIKKFGKKISTEYISEIKPGPSYARNIGIEQSKYDSIVLVDDDVLLAKDYLQCCYRTLSKYPEAAILGGLIKASQIDGNKLSFWLPIITDYYWLIAQSNFSYFEPTLINYPHTLFSASMCIQRNLLGPHRFDEKRLGKRYGKITLFAEDYEMCIRKQLENKLVLYDSRIHSTHLITHDRLTIKYFFRRLIISGVEQRIVDAKFRGKRGFISYQTNVRKYFSIIKQLISRKFSKRFLFSLFAEFARDFGYFFWIIPKPHSPGNLN